MWFIKVRRIELDYPRSAAKVVVNNVRLNKVYLCNRFE